MTPEQEDAHWALMGRPLMREWRAYCHAIADYHDYKRKAGIHQRLGLSSAPALASYSAEARELSLEIWRRCGFVYEPFGASAGGVFYSSAEGLVKLEDYDD